MTTQKVPVRFGRDIKKAVHSGDGYDDYITVYQFLREKIGILRQRINRMQKHIDDFYAAGGTIVADGGTYVISMDGASITVAYDGEGAVTGYSVEGMKGRRMYVRYMLGLFFATYMMPIYGRIINEAEDQIADLDTDNILRGISEIRDLVRGDRYLTSAAVSNMRIETEEDTDPFGIFGGDDE